jgi:hypothetical protein
MVNKEETEDPYNVFFNPSSSLFCTSIVIQENGFDAE